MAMEAVDKRLVRREHAIIQLLDPPFDKSDLNPGYIKGYVPGVRENGGQYTHAAIWAAMAFARLGDNRRAWELFAMINPVNHARSTEEAATYKVEHEHDHDERRHADLLQGLGHGKPVVFSHGWPLNADSWEAQMVFLASNGYRCIAHDRRGHGRSSQPWNGNDMDTYADDLAELIETLDLKDAVLIGFSAGGGEVARYIGRHGTKRVAKAALIAAVPPLMLKTAANPDGLPMEVFDEIRPAPSPTARSSTRISPRPVLRGQPARRQGLAGHDRLVLAAGMQAGHKNTFDCIKAFSETDFTEDLKKFDVPTLIIHGDDDQIVPIGAAALRSAKLVKNATLKIYAGRTPRPRGHAQRPAQRRPAGIP
jgi:non-heme chloroperoxidase